MKFRLFSSDRATPEGTPPGSDPRPLLATTDDSAERSERVIAICRLALSISAFAIIFIDPREPLYGSSALYIVLALYIAYSSTLLWLISNHEVKPEAISKPVLLADVAWFTAIVSLSEGGPSPFFLFYVFAVCSAGARWGMRTTVRVAVGSALLYLISVLGIRWFFTGPDFIVRSAHILRPTYLIILGYLVGFIGEHEISAKRRLVEMVAFQQDAGYSRNELRVLIRLFRRIVRFYRADYALLQIRAADGAGIEWEGTSKPGHRMVLHQVPNSAWTPASSGRLAYRVTHTFGNWGRRAEEIDYEKTEVRSFTSEAAEPAFLARVRTRSLIVIPISSPSSARGRLILGRSRENFSMDETNFCRALVKQAAVIHQSMMLQGKAETLAVAEERARIARDIHDGFVQSLASVDVGIEVCRKLQRKDPSKLDDELLELQRNIKQGYREARQYLDMLRNQAPRGADVDTAMAEVVREFRGKSETAIEFESNAGGVPAQHGVGFELLQIVREGLTNISRHANAEHASVSVDARERDIVVVIRDDGVGFPAAAEKSNGELTAAAAPWSIRERVESLSGELSIKSNVGGGSEIHVRLPRNGTR